MPETRTSRRATVDSDAITSSTTSKPLPLDDLYAMYPGEWVLAEVLEVRDDDGRALGRVLLHSRSCDDVFDEVVRVRSERPEIHISVFPGGSSIPSAEAAREIFAQAAERGPLNAFW